MTLGVKESVSGKKYALAANGDEVRVCGGKGAVYLSGAKVALRCCGKTSIVATRKTKQSVLRQGDVTLLDLRCVIMRTRSCSLSATQLLMCVLDMYKCVVTCSTRTGR